jgi:hypothetical protein
MQRRQGRLVALAASFSLLVVVSFGILHQFEHDGAHLAENCAVCTTVRAPLITAAASVPLAPVLVGSVVAAKPSGSETPFVSHSVRTIRGPPRV